MSAERRPIDALDDVVAMLQIVQPTWVSWYEPEGLLLHVHEMLVEGEEHARIHGHWSSGCVSVNYEAETGRITVDVTASYWHDEVNADAD